MSIQIDHPLVESVTLVKKSPWYMYRNTLCAIPIYAIGLSAFWKLDKVSAFVICGLIVFFHVLSFFMCLWSLRYRIHVQYRRVTTLEEADSIHVTAAANCGESSISALHVESDRKQNVYWWFDFQKLRFVSMKLENARMAFSLLDFPDNEPYETYLTWSGYSSDTLGDAQKKWGENDLQMPIPPFWELFLEHATEPFFVFQVFSVLLWCFDDYMAFTLFTLAMLVFMECMQVKQRIENMKSLRSMRNDVFPVLVYREKRWLYVNSVDLVPGDLVSVNSRKSYKQSTLTSDPSVIAPCDILLLDGTCVVNEALLTGESIPKTKVGLQTILTRENRGTRLQITVDNNLNKKNMLYGGTRIILHKCESNDGLPGVSRPTDKGCLGYVVRTGYYTAQGDMMRNMLYSSQRATANNKEAFSFILLLLCFAVAAAAYVFRVGHNDARRNQWKLLLHCIMIITNVVPPELPLELSYAVNNSLLALMKKNIFCTEPFRIPFGGKVKICYFDKTGTLTSDRLDLLGCVNSVGEREEDWKDIPALSGACMSTCHELIYLNGVLTGNQMELTALESSGWIYSNTGVAIPPKKFKSAGYSDMTVEKVRSLKPVYRFGFESANRRMTVVCVNEGAKALRVFMKGAPEMVEQFLQRVPDDYVELYRKYTLEGKRVIALAWKDLPESVRVEDLKQISRKTIESGLFSCGFLLFDCPLKTATRDTVNDLVANRYTVRIITGDNPYTACQIARECDVIAKEKPVLVLNQTREGALFWESLRISDKPIAFVEDERSFAELANEFVLCIIGSVVLYKVELLQHLVPYVTIFSRMSPQQKGEVIRETKRREIPCLMCGDGTNDVAALKQAHVGVSIMNNVELEERLAKEEVRFRRQKSVEEGKLGDSPVTMMFRQVGNRRMSMKKSNFTIDPYAKPSVFNTSIEDLRDELMRETQESTVLKLGDASIASPFTCKSTGIDKVLQILRYGRCTLVTTFQIYIILALNSLISAYSLSILYIDGVKNGDFQMTVSGVLIAGLFFFVSSSKPLSKLSPEKPHTKLFSWRILATITGQFLVHFGILATVRRLTLPYVDFSSEEMMPDADFKPNVLNTVEFLISISMQLFVFLVNYQGHPFMQSIRENTSLYYGFIVCFSFFFLLSLEILPPINRMMDLVPFPSFKFKMQFNALAILDGAAAFVIDRVLKFVDRKTGH